MSKVIIATYNPREVAYKIPVGWDLADINIRWGKLYYKGKEQNVRCMERESDSKFPDEVCVAEGHMLEDEEDDDDNDDVSICGLCGESLSQDANMGACMCGGNICVCQKCAKWSETKSEWLCGKGECVE